MNEVEKAELILRHLDSKLHLRSYLSQGIREDGRGLLDQRPLSVNSGLLNNDVCFGSSFVSLGSTVVSCGITVLVGKPSTNYPEHGDVGESHHFCVDRHFFDNPSFLSVFDVSLWPLASPKYDQRSKPDAAYVLEDRLNVIFTRLDV